MFSQTEFVIKRSEIADISDIPKKINEVYGDTVLRWFISYSDAEIIKVDLTESTLLNKHFDQTVQSEVYAGKTAVLSIVPTGIGCDIGGYAADAAPSTALLASCTDYLITNPNAVNASNFISMPENVLYTEGFLIDKFCMGRTNLYKPNVNKVGLIIENTSDEDLDVVFNIINTVRAVYGINIEHYVITKKKIGSRCVQNASGAYVGTVDNPDVLYSACDELISKGVNAIAVTTNVQDLPHDFYVDHFNGDHPNPVGGVEAIISHSICEKYKIPSAHAPMINLHDLDLVDKVVDARGAGEISSASGLACVLIGLNKAPQTELRKTQIKDVVNINNLSAVVAPASALGSIPVIYAHELNIPIIAVKDNGTILDVNKDVMGMDDVIVVENYFEAAGVLQAIKAGINLNTVTRPLKTLNYKPVLEKILQYK